MLWKQGLEVNERYYIKIIKTEDWTVGTKIKVILQVLVLISLQHFTEISHVSSNGRSVVFTQLEELCVDLLSFGSKALNSVNQLISVMVKCGVLFEVRTEFLNVI
jgi:hypothetical protein